MACVWSHCIAHSARQDAEYQGRSRSATRSRCAIPYHVGTDAPSNCSHADAASTVPLTIRRRTPPRQPGRAGEMLFTGVRDVGVVERREDLRFTTEPREPLGSFASADRSTLMARPDYLTRTPHRLPAFASSSHL